jgi:hypothetical protein
MKKIIHAGLMILLIALSLQTKAATPFIPSVHSVIFKKIFPGPRVVFDGRHLIRRPDLIVSKIHPFKWDRANQRTIIKVTVKNIGLVKAKKSLLRVMDPSTSQRPNTPYKVFAFVPDLAAGTSYTATLYLPYWIFNPDASLEAKADFNNKVLEIRENNNTLVFYRVG